MRPSLFRRETATESMQRRTGTVRRVKPVVTVAGGESGLISHFWKGLPVGKMLLRADLQHQS